MINWLKRDGNWKAILAIVGALIIITLGSCQPQQRPEEMAELRGYRYIESEHIVVSQPNSSYSFNVDRFYDPATDTWCYIYYSGIACK